MCAGDFLYILAYRYSYSAPPCFSLSEAFRAPVFRTGSDKNGFSLGFRKNVAQVFGDQKKYWPLPLFTR